MKESIKDMIDAIKSDDTIAAASSFTTALGEKIFQGIEARRIEVARSMFVAQPDEMVEESVEEELEEIEDGVFFDGSEPLGEADRTSTSYQFTHTPGDAESEKKLADLKASVKGTNKRVVLQGRLGKNNPNAHKYSKAAYGTPASASSGGHTHQRIKTADAAHHDVYVYNK